MNIKIIKAICIVTSAVLIFWLITELNSEENSKKTNEPLLYSFRTNPTISNPVYLSNPQDYYIDYDNKVTSKIPEDTPLWVEEILNGTIRDNEDEENILFEPTPIFRVSFPSEKSGAKIIELEDVHISSLEYPMYHDVPLYMWDNNSRAKCWVNGEMLFLNQNFLHKPIYLAIKKIASSKNGFSTFNGIRTEINANKIIGYSLLMDSQPPGEKWDVAQYIIRNGYGSTGKYPGDLKDAEEIASLENRGLWGTCK
jgi:hypothetical protein